jgi:hypothetical protein
VGHRLGLGNCKERILIPVGGRIPLFKLRIDAEEDMRIITSRDMSSEFLLSSV